MGCDNPRVFKWVTSFWLLVAFIAVCMWFAGHIYSSEASVGEPDTGMPLIASGAALCATSGIWICIHQRMFKKKYLEKSIYDRLSEEEQQKARAELKEIDDKYDKSSRFNVGKDKQGKKQELDAFWEKHSDEKRLGWGSMDVVNIATFVVFVAMFVLFIAGMITTVMDRDGPCRVAGSPTRIILLIAPGLLGVGACLNTYFCMNDLCLKFSERMNEFKETLRSPPTDPSVLEPDDVTDKTETSQQWANDDSMTKTSSPENSLTSTSRLMTETSRFSDTTTEPTRYATTLRKNNF